MQGTTRRLCIAAAGLTLGTAATATTAQLVDISIPGTTLQDVISGGGQFQVADKLFTVTDYFSAAFNANAIGISPLDFGFAGRGFRLTDAWVDLPGDNIASDFTLSYMVEIVDDPSTPGVDEGADPRFVIVDNRLVFDGFAGGPGSFARVDETLELGDGSLFGNKSVFALGDGTSQLQDMLNWDASLGIKKLNIIKDAQFFVPTVDGFAGASFIDQTFSQVPTPGAVSLIAIAGVAAARRKR